MPCRLVLPTSSMSGVRMHFCTLAAREYGGVRWPRKNGTNCTMPALMNSRFGSSIAGSGALGTTVCPLASKWARNRRLISAVLIGTAYLPRWLCRRSRLRRASTGTLGKRRLDLRLALGHAVTNIIDEAR